jgi:sulfite reductase alpha subunit-like flavoprotein
LLKILLISLWHYFEQSSILKFNFETVIFARIRYDAGDHVAIYPTNNTELVERIGQLLNLDLDTVFTMKNLVLVI